MLGITKQMTPTKEKPKQKQRSPKRFIRGAIMIQKTEFRVGDAVYARYHGDDVLTIVGIADVKALAPHYICETSGQRWVISKLHLSTKRLTCETDDGNRLQLALPLNNA